MGKKKVPSDEEILLKALPADPEIKQEYNRLLTLFGGADGSALALQRKTIARAAFLSITCDRLEKDIAENGYESEYRNGEFQTGKKKSTAADLLPNYTKLFLSCMKQLQGTLRPQRKDKELDELEEFLLESWKKDKNAYIPD
ncbi:MAG: hypothetical protein K6A68_09725 [Clostridiales bacterium]|nr:hypothetical protein [Clostridiales bacterium]